MTADGDQAPAATGESGESGEYGESGTLERLGDRSVLRYRRRLAHPQDTVWRALTEDAHLAGWFPTTIEGERSAGAALRFSFREGEGAPFVGEMLEFDPPACMELRWADDVLRFELTPDGAGCVLALTVTFPEHGKAARDAAGWHVCLEQLAFECAGDGLPWRPPDRWRAVHGEYVARLGPEASAIGPPEEWERAHGT
ncbi:MAG TPA: SRPBCC domain-containing protein [Acidimicrobiales bacterium]|nr:SRPBCC domain-containing protein [Acidimicrobiales bacterium]